MRSLHAQLVAILVGLVLAVAVSATATTLALRTRVPDLFTAITPLPDRR